MQYLRIPIALMAWATLALQLYLTVTAENSLSMEVRLVNLFSYFTILTTLLAASSLTFVNIRLFWDSRTHGAITIYIVSVGLIYGLFLQKLYDPQGLYLLTDVAFHYVIPFFYLIHWFFVVEKGDYIWKYAVRWLVFPGIYFLYILFRGLFTDWYPYPFIDVSELGYLYAFRNSLVVAFTFWLLGMGLIAIDRVMSRPERIGAD